MIVRSSLIRVVSPALGLVASLLVLSQDAAASYSSLILSDNPTGYWRLGEAGPIVSGTTQAADQTGDHHAVYYRYPHNGATTGVTAGLPGAIQGDANTAVNFGTPSGNTTYSAGGTAAIFDADAFNITTGGAFSIEAWISLPEVTNAHLSTNLAIFSKNNISNGSGYTFGIGGLSVVDGKGVIDSISFSSSGVGGSSISSTAINYNVGEWYHVVFTYDEAQNAKIYLNGEVIAERTNRTFSANSTGPALIGAVHNSSLNVGTNPPQHYAPFPGLIDEVAFYHHTLTEAQVQAHYAAAIPEPGTVALLALGGIAGVLLRSRRKGTV